MPRPHVSLLTHLLPARVLSAGVLLVGLLAASAGLAPEAHAQRVFLQQDTLRTASALPTELFGAAVAVDGDRALVAALLDDASGTADAGAVYVYVYDPATDTWALEATLTANDAASGDDFGISVALSGDRALVGAPENDENERINSGSAYVFARTGDPATNGGWVQETKLTASDAAGLDFFGVSVSLDSDRALVGARLDDDGGNSSGSAYVFARTGDPVTNGGWVQEAKLTASDAAEDDRFGTSVSLDSDRALVSARQDDDGGNSSGSAYVFARTGDPATNGGWVQQAKLTASDAAMGDFFGTSVSLSGDRALVGAENKDDGGRDSGSAYVFARTGDPATNGGWIQQSKLTASDAALRNRFGTSVSLNDDRALVGSARGAPTPGGRRGKGGYVFEYVLPATLSGAEGYRMLAHPGGGTVADLLSSTYTQGFPGSQDPDRSFCSVYAYDETAVSFAAGYACVGSVLQSVPLGTGLLAYLYDDEDREAPGTQGGFPKTIAARGTPASVPFSGFAITVTDSPTAPAFEEGWNLLGNPLEDGIDWDLMTRSGGMTGSVYVFDPGYLGGDYRTWSAGVGGDLADGVIPAFQGFFVQAGALPAGLEIPEAAVVADPGVLGRDASGTEAGAPLRLGLSVEGSGDGSDDSPREVSAAFVAVADGAALGVDARDALRLAPGAWPLTVLSTEADPTEAESDTSPEPLPLAINALPSDAEGEVSVPLRIAAEGHAEGPLALRLAWTGTLPEGWTATLLDREAGTRTEIVPGASYGFTATVTEAGAGKTKTLRLGLPVGPFASREAAKTETTAYDSGDRFALVVTPARIVSTEAGGTEAFALGPVAPNPTRGTAEVALALPEAGTVTVAVFDALGRLVASERRLLAAGSQRVSVPVTGLAPGAYVVRVDAPGGGASRRLTVIR